MRITIQTPGADLAEQVRAYAEYRVFSAVARFGKTVDRVAVSLVAEDPDPDALGKERHFSCSIVARTTWGEQVKVRAGSDHPYSVVDRAARQMTSALERRHAATPAGGHAGELRVEA